MKEDHQFIREALELAARGRGRVGQNPMVGAVVVQEGRVVGRGYHRRFGGPHAEIEALRRAASRLQGGTLYVTLEPCSHWGKTPPCVQAVVHSGISRVVVAMEDPNPLVRGRGVRLLRAAGVRVEVGLQGARARALNRAFLRRLAAARPCLPYTIIRTAMTVDGKINRASATSQTLLSPLADLLLRDRFRAEMDAILVGGRTALLDDPRLTIRSVRLQRARVKRGASPDPMKVTIFEDASKLCLTGRFLQAGKCEKVIFATKKTPRAVLERLEPFAHVYASKAARVNLRQAFLTLGHLGVRRLLVEGGGRLNFELLRLGLVHELHVKVAPRIFGGTGAPHLLDGEGFLPHVSPRLHFLNGERITKNFVILKYKVEPRG